MDPFCDSIPVSDYRCDGWDQDNNSEIQSNGHCSDTAQHECVFSVAAAEECVVCCVSTCSFGLLFRSILWATHGKAESFFYQNYGPFHSLS